MNALLEYDLIGDFVKQHPEVSETMERYFGPNCLKRPGFKIQTLGMACILFGVDRKKLFKELKDFQN